MHVYFPCFSLKRFVTESKSVCVQCNILHLSLALIENRCIDSPQIITNYGLFISIPSFLLPQVLFKMGRHLNVQTASDTSLAIQI